jgi:hypothetical protein
MDMSVAIHSVQSDVSAAPDARTRRLEREISESFRMFDQGY